MKTKNLINGLLLSGLVILSSCKKDSATPEPANLDCNSVENGIAVLDDCETCHQSYMYEGMGVMTYVATYADTVGVAGTFVLAGSSMDIMSNPNWNNCNKYTFNHQGQSTVSYGGQTARLIMASEMLSALNSSSTTTADLVSMWNNDGWNWASADANASTKNIGGKTAAGNETPLTSSESAAVIDKFVAWFTDYSDNVAQIMDGDETSHPAMAGTAGWIENRELNAHGFEYDQFVAKTLIGGMCLDQVVNGYLSPTKLDVDNADRSEGHTAMEHHWDEGFGYVYGKFGPENADGDLSTDGLLGKYLNKDAFATEKAAVFQAFIDGRQAIVDMDYTERDAQALIIKNNLSVVVAQKAHDYLTGASADVASLNADYFHGLSEGYGFIMSLQFTNFNGAPYFTHTEVMDMIANLEAGNGFWDRTASELDAMAAQIQAAAGL
jgi:hypothetical protein